MASRVLALLVLFALLGLCALGLLSTLEPMGDSSPVVWQLGYGGGSIVVLALIIRLLTKPRNDQEPR